MKFRQKVSIERMGFMAFETYYGEFIENIDNTYCKVDLIERCPIHGKITIVKRKFIKAVNDD